MILVFTRKIDASDPRVGFFLSWIRSLSQRAPLSVIAWQKGAPEGVKVPVLEMGPGGKAVKVWRTQNTLSRLLPKSSGIFVHQMPEYALLSAPLARLFRKKMVSWYTHGTVSRRMRWMERVSDVVLTASRESFRIPSSKVRIVGHGIDTGLFRPAEDRAREDVMRLISVGRISPSKDIETIIQAVRLLKKKGVKVRLQIVGDVGLPSQRPYLEALTQMVMTAGLSEEVVFAGPRPWNEIPSLLRESDIAINMSGTGSLDKAVLEAMACGVMVVTSNEAFRSLLPERCQTMQNNPSLLAEKIRRLWNLSDTEWRRQTSEFREKVVRSHSVERLAGIICSLFGYGDEAR